LGLNVVGETENYGTEQEHLNNIFGARLRITTLRAPKGPGIEFLEYITPRDGRPTSDDSRANDLWHWQMRLRVRDTEAAAQSVRRGRGRLISQGVIALTDDQFDYSKSTLARDPDGHALLFTDK
jgi:hypothetical protein